MKILNHTVQIDNETFVPQHSITIQITQELIDDLRFHSLYTNGIDFLAEYRQVFGDEFWERIFEPLIQGKNLV